MATSSNQQLKEIPLSTLDSQPSSTSPQLITIETLNQNVDNLKNVSPMSQLSSIPPSESASPTNLLSAQPSLSPGLSEIKSTENAPLTLDTNLSTFSDFKADKKKKSVRDSISVQDIQVALEKLEVQRIELEECGDYLGAAHVMDQIKKLSLKQANLIKQQIVKKQNEKLKAMKEKHKKEIEEFEKIWSVKLAEYDKKAKEVIVSTMERQQFELKELTAHLRQECNMKRPKYSQEVLNLRRQMLILVKQKKYIEAEKIKRQIKVKIMYQTD